MDDKKKAKLFADVYEGRADEVIQFLNSDKSLISIKDSNERLLIHWAALGGHCEIVRHLLSQGSSVDPQDDMHMTPLILASSAGRYDVVRLLVSAGANVNSRNIQGHSPLQYAASKGWKDIVKLLLDEGAEVNIEDVRGARPLHRASSIGHLQVVTLLLGRNNIEIDARDREGNTPLHLSCEEDRGEVARLLIEKGARLDVENKEKKTPIDLASFDLARQLRTLVQ
ncbi:26S proteasome non-ATPase regulatory subunit 10-like [Macrosteles quadrilineatus]|uniref:26S proteasome non-ATPase regulatory subunit 10-like n=1 Tax=Macrosteles quadrilineatus TaxID=74068 RepID=UPI0023E2F2DF|nr:26S proteasome non-ATPase regulatory subunit 10-like [Macrosteles quadrilineatus]